jgi:hypothetical protein
MSAVLDLDALEALAAECIIGAMRAKALDGKWFNISGLDKIDNLFDSEAEKAARNSREWKFLRRLHCLNFADMPLEVREAIPALFEAVMGIARANFAERQS